MVAPRAPRLRRASAPALVVTVPAVLAATPGTPMAGPVATPTVARRGPRAVVTAGPRPGLVGPVAARAAAREAVQTAGQVLQGPTRRATRLAVTPPPGPVPVVTTRVVPATRGMVVTVPLRLLLLLVVLAAMRARRVTPVLARPTLARVVTRPAVRALPPAARVPLEQVVRVARST